METPIMLLINFALNNIGVGTRCYQDHDLLSEAEADSQLGAMPLYGVDVLQLSKILQLQLHLGSIQSRDSLLNLNSLL